MYKSPTSRSRIRPCPACGQESRIPAGSWCHTCEMDRIRGLATRHERTITTAGFNARPYSYPTVDDGVHTAFAAMIVSMCGESKDRVDVFVPGTSTTEYRVVVDKNFDVDTVTGLMREISKYGQNRYDQGLKRGRDMLRQMAAGEMTLKDFERG